MPKQQVIICHNFIADLENAIGNQPENSIYILTDSHTQKLCLPLLSESKKCANARVCNIQPGDSHKNVETLASVWQFLCDNEATRKSLLINLGGGMVTDLGGFAASTFKRGMRYINIPTTLLGAVDAAVGGKTGINFNGLKNEVGVINPAETVLIETSFFETLDHENLVSGMAEILKHALIYSREEWEKVSAFDLDKFDLTQFKPILASSIEVKERIVEEDPREQGIRKALNFGHTVGHAFESISYEKGTPALHGYAVAWGMICELYLSHKLLGFPKDILIQAVSLIKENYGALSISCKDYDRLFELMTHDKKNDSKEINFTLLANIGGIRINQNASQKLIFESLDFYCDSVGL
jgi:3-dehydroquinate synthase